jgi:hypothetical protein
MDQDNWTLDFYPDFFEQEIYLIKEPVLEKEPGNREEINQVMEVVSEPEIKFDKPGKHQSTQKEPDKETEPVNMEGEGSVKEEVREAEIKYEEPGKPQLPQKEIVKEAEPETREEIKQVTEVVSEAELKNENTENPESPQMEFLGEFKQKLCILVSYEEAEWIIPKDKIILEKILESVNLNWEDIALFNTKSMDFKGSKHILENLKPNRMITFGPEFIKSPNIKADKVFVINDCKMLLCSDNLTTLALNRERKLVLWNNLKEMFNIKK